LFSASLKTSTVAKRHILVTRAPAIGLVRLAQQAAGPGGLRAFALVVHVVIYTRSTKLSTTFFSNAIVSLLLSTPPRLPSRGRDEQLWAHS
jgi:hypothetical protein